MIQGLGVVTPLYSTPQNNRLSYFKDTVGSVLAQDYDFLWTIVDDGSTDQDTIDFLKDISTDPRIKIKTRRRQSGDKKTASNALNIGFNFLFQNGCQYFTYVHSDDLLTQGSLEMRVEELKNNDMVYGRVGYIRKMGVVTRRYPPNYDFSSPLGMKAGFPHHASMWSRGMMELMMKGRKNELFDRNMGCGEDLDVSLYSRRLIERYRLKLAFVDKLVYIRVENEGNITYTMQTREKIKQLKHAYEKNQFHLLWDNLRMPFFWLPGRIKGPLKPLRKIVNGLGFGMLHPIREELVDINPYWFRKK